MVPCKPSPKRDPTWEDPTVHHYVCLQSSRGRQWYTLCGHKEGTGLILGCTEGFSGKSPQGQTLQSGPAAACKWKTRLSLELLWRWFYKHLDQDRATADSQEGLRVMPRDSCWGTLPDCAVESMPGWQSPRVMQSTVERQSCATSCPCLITTGCAHTRRS